MTRQLDNCHPLSRLCKHIDNYHPQQDYMTIQLDSYYRRSDYMPRQLDNYHLRSDYMTRQLDNTHLLTRLYDKPITQLSFPDQIMRQDN